MFKIIKILPFILALTATPSFAAFNFASGVTVSGLSSGAYMAGQLHVAFSKTITGAGIIAGGPYGCARGSLITALMQCMDIHQGAPDGQQLYNQASKLARSGSIDSLENLADDKVYLLSGLRDRTVLPAVAAANVDFYSMLSSRDLIFVDDMAVGHAFPTLNHGNPCETRSESPWISNCDRDIAGEMLNHLMGKLKARTSVDPQAFYSYAQPTTSSMASKGIAYIPSVCRQGAKCRLHVSLHGCHQVRGEVGDVYYTQTGINEWAQANNIVVLYPQAIKDQWLGNPNGCWDWWGYSGSDYATKSGVQMRAIKQAIDNFFDNTIQFESLHD